MYGLNFGRHVVFIRQKILGGRRGKFASMSPDDIDMAAQLTLYIAGLSENLCEICLTQSAKRSKHVYRFLRLKRNYVTVLC